VDLPAELPGSLTSRGIAVTTDGLVDVGWLRDDALEIVRALRGTTVAVVGGDVFVRQAWGFAATTECWNCERAPGESTPDFSSRSRDWAREFLTEYDLGPAGDVVFVLYFDTHQDAA
jgi:hypothetical protein